MFRKGSNLQENKISINTEIKQVNYKLAFNSKEFWKQNYRTQRKMGKTYYVSRELVAQTEWQENRETHHTMF